MKGQRTRRWTAAENKFGVISFMHRNVFCQMGKTLEYEEDFIRLFEKYHSVFIESGAEDFDFFTEIYYCGDQLILKYLIE